jgi:protein-disulfide isomerase
VRGKGAPRARRASPRVLIVAGAILAAAAVAVVLGIVLTGGKSDSLKDVPTVGSLQAGLPGAGTVNALFKGVPQAGITLGRSDAPVTLVEYLDAQCPYCREFETTVMPDLVSKYVRTGKLRVVMQPWAFIGPDSFRGQAAVLAAGKQNKAFDYLALLYQNQGTENTGWLDDQMVADIAAGIPGLRVHDLLAERGSAAVKAAAQKVDEQAKADGVGGTPTIFVGKTGTKGQPTNLRSPTDEQPVVSAIQAALGS